jgi:ribulose-5-phosphate 4-epimerase/fuculose-1-phosphate aldolase
MYRASRSQHVPLCSGTHSPCVMLGPVFTHTHNTPASPSLFGVTRADSPVMLTLLLPRDAKSFRISHQEMIKGVRIGGHGKTLRFFDTLEVPIIENTADEEDLTSGMAEAMEKYPQAAAILVRRHGVYVWGMCFISWWK